MAKQVEGISEKVELCAKKEFLEKGYVDASLRTIAAEAGTTTGTIYSRYGGKEGLFSAIVEPVAKEFTGIFIGVQEKFHAIESDRQAVKALFESFFEVIRHDMSEEEAWEYIEMLEKYHSAGWNIIYGECCSIND